jgi:glucose/arabinose dehydrogenase
VLGNLPVVNTEHAPGALTLGPDGFVYLPVGGPDRLPRAPELLKNVSHQNSRLVGTIGRFRPGDDRLEVVATGIRNVFEVTFDPDGRILGVDNGGEAARGWRLEQLIEIQPQRDYGYPLFGTFSEAAPPPLWILDARASAGIAWIDGGVLVGAFEELLFVPLLSDAHGLYVPNRQVVRELMSDLGGFVTAIEPLGDDRFAVTVFDPSGARNALHVIELTGSGG